MTRLFEREAEAAIDEQPVQGCQLVDTVIAIPCAAVDGMSGQEAELIVVTQLFNRHPREAREFTDLEHHSSRSLQRGQQQIGRLRNLVAPHPGRTYLKPAQPQSELPQRGTPEMRIRGAVVARAVAQ